MDRWERLTQLIGKDGFERLRQSRVLVAGLGGVGSFCAEALVRCGVGTVGALDADLSEPSNINRQLFALTDTLGEQKAVSFEKRAKQINPDVIIHPYPMFLNRETFESLDYSGYDIVADCIDSLVPKLNLILHCLKHDIPIVASTGAGFKLDPTMVQSGSIWETKHDPLAHRMRKKLRQWGFGHRDFPVVYSLETRPDTVSKSEIIGSMVTVTGTFGLTVAAVVLEKLLSKK